MIETTKFGGGGDGKGREASMRLKPSLHRASRQEKSSRAPSKMPSIPTRRLSEGEVTTQHRTIKWRERVDGARKGACSRPFCSS